jgi:hypothetical protein
MDGRLISSLEKKYWFKFCDLGTKLKLKHKLIFLITQLYLKLNFKIKWLLTILLQIIQFIEFLKKKCLNKNFNEISKNI